MVQYHDIHGMKVYFK
uniref:Uncharacterized protein n=1 Tax=Anguilla anguilla TaxID=7936 RepID=A0A0E9UGJ3_ANGAN